VISEGAGGEMISRYKSIIYYHEDRPRWFETIKVLLRLVSIKNIFFAAELIANSDVAKVIPIELFCVRRNM